MSSGFIVSCADHGRIIIRMAWGSGAPWMNSNVVEGRGVAAAFADDRQIFFRSSPAIGLEQAFARASVDVAAQLIAVVGDSDRSASGHAGTYWC
jgi:hypothetical protein